MKKVILATALAFSMTAFSAAAADLISKDEAHHFKYEYIGNVSVGATNGEVGSPSDLQYIATSMRAVKIQRAAERIIGFAVATNTWPTT